MNSESCEVCTLILPAPGADVQLTTLYDRLGVEIVTHWLCFHHRQMHRKGGGLACIVLQID